MFDLQHSIEFTGMINEEYFHCLYDGKKWSESYELWSNHYNKWYNKYRNEIYNWNKIVEEELMGKVMMMLMIFLNVNGLIVKTFFVLYTNSP